VNTKLVPSTRISKPASLLAFDVDFLCRMPTKEIFLFYGERVRQGVRADIGYRTLVPCCLCVFLASRKQFGTRSEGEARMNSSCGKGRLDGSKKGERVSDLGGREVSFLLIMYWNKRPLQCAEWTWPNGAENDILRIKSNSTAPPPPNLRLLSPYSSKKRKEIHSKKNKIIKEAIKTFDA
jgi:hypothetical protein